MFDLKRLPRFAKAWLGQGPRVPIRRASSRRLSFESLEERVTPSASLVTDINTVATTQGSSPQSLVAINSLVYFSATEPTHGRELWKSDGTAAGTVLVKDIEAGSGDSNPGNLTNVNGTLFFTASDAATGTELWKSDGTAAGTVLVKDIVSGVNSSFVSNLTNVNGTLYFVANDGVNGSELWKSDGTTAGTVLVKNIRSGNTSSNPTYLTNVGGTLYFSADDGTNGRELWKSDGTSSGTVLVKDIRSGGNSFPDFLTNVNGTLYFSADDGTNGRELWKSDGTPAGTVMVKNINSGLPSSYPAGFTSVGSTLYFTAQDGTTGYELWKSDGTAAGTVLVKDIRTGSNSSSPWNLTNLNGTLLFTANDGTNGRELWKSDGTSAGTLLVKDIRTGSGNSSYPSFLTVVNGTAYLVATDGSTGDELWKTDGTGAGTSLVKDIRNGPLQSYISSITNVNGSLFFSATDGLAGVELWKSTGSSAGTVRVKDIWTGTAGGSTYGFTDVNGTLFFSANNVTNGQELWTSDGTAANTVLVKDIFPGAGWGGNSLYTVNGNGTLYFTGNDGVTGRELWKSDGTTGGTVLVKDIAASGGPSGGHYQRGFAYVAGTVYFVAEDGVNGYELWKTDGTTGGTSMVKDIDPTGDSFPRYLTNVNGTLYFTAFDGTNGRELWKSDGTPGGTTLVKDINPGGSSYIRYLVNLGGMLYFQADDGTNGKELWKSDGTPGGTTLVKDINPSGNSSPTYLVVMGGSLYFEASDGTTGFELWKSDGSTAGTVLVKDINSGGGSSYPWRLTVAGSTLYFSAIDATNGRELWKSDGTAAGTVLLKDIRSGSLTSNPSYLTNFNGTLYFTANDGINGTEIWRSDGTPSGTVLDTQLVAGSGDALPQRFKVSGSRLFFTADDGLTGRELWTLLATDLGNVQSNQATTDAVTIKPYLNATLTDIAARPMNITVSFPTADGDFTVATGWTASTNNGTTTYSKSNATQTDLRALTFQPTAVNWSTTRTTTFTLVVTDGVDTLTDANCSIVVSPVNDPPTLTVISNSGNPPSVNDNATITPFTSTVTALGDVDVNQNLKITIAYTGANGTFVNPTAPNGFTWVQTTGQLVLTGTNANPLDAATALTAIKALVFKPTTNQFSPGTTTGTTFAVSVFDGTATVSGPTSISALSIDDLPTITGAVAGQAINDTQTVQPFANLNITDPDVGQTQTVTIAYNAANGTLTNLGGFTGSAGGYSFIGTASAAQSAIRAMIFNPTVNQTSVNGTTTTTFTVNASTNSVVMTPATNNQTTVATTVILKGTTVTANVVSATFSGSSQLVAVSSTVSSSFGIVNQGTVQYTVRNSLNVIIAQASVAVANGQAATNVSIPANSPVGIYSITAAYSGGSFFALSSNSTTLTIGQALTTTTASTVTAEYQAADQDVVLSADVSSTTPVTGGTVTFTIRTSGNVLVGDPVTANVVNGSASTTFTLPGTIQASTLKISAAYEGNASFADSSDNTAKLVVSKASTGVLVEDTVATYRSGTQTVLIHAGVTTSLGVATQGTVSFAIMNGAIRVGNLATAFLSNGQSTGRVTLPAGTPVGSYSIVVTYNGALNFQSSTDSSATLTVDQAVTTAKPNAATAVYRDTDQLITLSSVVASTGRISGGVVTFSVTDSNGNPIGQDTTSNAVVNSGASVQFVLPGTTPVGTYLIRATYSGGTNYADSPLSLAKSLIISKPLTTVVVTSTTATYQNADQTVTLSAAVNSKLTVVDGGLVTFVVRNASGRTIGASVTGVVSAGIATADFILPQGTPAGTLRIAANYDGGTNFRISHDLTKTLIVTKADSLVDGVDAFADYRPASQEVILTASVTSSAGEVNQGVVTFTIRDIDGKLIGTFARSTTVSAGVATARFILPAGAKAGTYLITTAYSGGLNFVASIDSTKTLTVS